VSCRTGPHRAAFRNNCIRCKSARLCCLKNPMLEVGSQWIAITSARAGRTKSLNLDRDKVLRTIVICPVIISKVLLGVLRSSCRVGLGTAQCCAGLPVPCLAAEPPIRSSIIQGNLQNILICKQQKGRPINSPT
jgi:hypothetical protein